MGTAATRELVRAFVPRYAAGDPIPEVEVFEDRFAEALPDGAFTREIPVGIRPRGSGT